MSDKMTEREERVELFKTAATFGFLTAAMFCLGVPLIVGYVPLLTACSRQDIVWKGWTVAMLVVAWVLLMPIILPWRIRSSPGQLDSKDTSQDQSEESFAPLPIGGEDETEQ